MAAIYSPQRIAGSAVWRAHSGTGAITPAPPPDTPSAPPPAPVPPAPSGIVNARDLRLQSTSPRLVPVQLPGNIVVPAVKRIRLDADSLTFKVGTTGVPLPAAITITATLVHLAGEISWTCTGGTLTGTGSTRQLAYADMTADTAFVQATVTEAGIVYTGLITIVKVRDGQHGTDGERGTVQLARAITGATWIDEEASAAIAANGNGVPIPGDVVTLFNLSTTPQYSEARVYTAGAWSPLAAYFPGSILVDDSVVARKINGRDLKVLAGGFTGYAWPAAGQDGFFLGPQGLLLGNANDGQYFQVDRSGKIYAPGLSVEGGVLRLGTSGYLGTLPLSNVESTAGAQQRANAAYVAAVEAANTAAIAQRVIAEAYADGIVTAEEARAIADATAKANAAQAAAIAAAASDATTKSAPGAAAYAAITDTLTGLGARLSAYSRGVLSGTGGIAAGSLYWDSSGNYLGGSGTAMTSRGIVGYDSGAPMFAMGTDGRLVVHQADVINTLNLAGQAVTVPLDQEGLYGELFNPEAGFTRSLTTGYGSFPAGTRVTMMVVITCTQTYGGDIAVKLCAVNSSGDEIELHSSVHTTLSGHKINAVFAKSYEIPYDNSWRFRVYARNSWGSGQWRSDKTNIIVAGSKR